MNLCLHAEKVLVRMGARGPEVVGGPLMTLGAWAPQREINGPQATAQLAGDLTAAGVAGSFVVV